MVCVRMFCSLQSILLDVTNKVKSERLDLNQRSPASEAGGIPNFPTPSWSAIEELNLVLRTPAPVRSRYANSRLRTMISSQSGSEELNLVLRSPTPVRSRYATTREPQSGTDPEFCTYEVHVLPLNYGGGSADRNQTGINLICSEVPQSFSHSAIFNCTTNLLLHQFHSHGPNTRDHQSSHNTRCHH